MTDDLVGRLKRLMAEANEGPWHLMEAGFGKSSSPTIYATDEDLRYVARFRDGPCFHSATPDLANAKLAVEAVNSIPALIARIEALEAAISTIMARCEAIEDEAADGLANDNTPHAEGFQRGEKYTAKSIRRHLHDLTRAALTPEAPHAD